MNHQDKVDSIKKRRKEALLDSKVKNGMTKKQEEHDLFLELEPFTLGSIQY
jgi:hypothetical protein